MSEMSANLGSRSTLHLRLVLVTFLICSLGVANIYSAAVGQSFWIKQIFWLVCGFGVAFLHLAFDYRVFLRVAYPLYGVVCMCLVGVLLFGTKVLGARRWLRLGGFNFQPSELMKVAIIFVLAKYFAEEQRERGYTVRDLLRPLNVSRPVLALIVLIVLWSKNPFLRDPVGELSRIIAVGFEGHAPEWDGTYSFRMLLVVLILASSALAFWIYTLEGPATSGFSQRTRLMDRSRIAFIFGLPALAGIALLAFWQSEFFGDPKTVILTWLIQQGLPTGSHAEFEPVIWFRLLLLGLLLLYLGYAVWRLARKKGSTEMRDYVAPIDLVLLPMAMIMAQPDLGTALLVGSISFSIILFVGMRFTSVIILAFSGVGLSVVAWFALLKQYQKDRVLMFMDPEADAKGRGYHAIQSMIAVGSGRLSGKGFAAGTQSQLSFLPEQHTDFAFSVWGEEHGFLGGLVLVSLYFLLVVVAVGVAARARDKFGALLVTGFTSLIFWQAFVNMGMVIGLLPVVGVPLPLFSYGGSSMLTVMVGIGITLNVAYRRNTFG